MQLLLLEEPALKHSHHQSTKANENNKNDSPAFLTMTGARRLGEIIRESRIALDWSMDKAIAEIQKRGGSIAKSGLSCVERGTTLATYNTLVAIAAAKFVRDGDKVLGIDDFIAILSERYPVDEVQKESQPSGVIVSQQFISMIHECMRLNNLTLNQIEKLFLNMKTSADSSIERLREILSGSLPNDDELRVVRFLLDPYEQHFSEDDWLVAVFGEQHANGNHY